MADYFQVKNQNIFNPPANTSLGNASNQFNDVYVQNDLVLGNVTVTGTTIIAPRITTITYPGDDTAADTAGGQTITLTGTGFVAGASVLINGSAVGVVSVVSSTTITFTSPANTTGSYVIYVINPDGSTAIAIPGIQYSGTPTWTTAAGTLGNVYETANFTQTVTATGDAPITYSVVTGSIPPGSTFNANGTITGTSQLSASPTTYSFTVRATDAQLQDTNRAFSISVIPDVVTWSNPTNNTTYTQATNVAISNIALSATSAVGSGITYSANTLPTGLSLTGANISGTPTVSANTSSLLTATANTTSESSSITINWIVSVASDPYFMYNSLLLPGTGTNGAQNNTFLDGSTNNFTITRAGNTTQGTFSPYGPNWSNYFDGVQDGLITPVTAGNLVNTDFTWEAWVNFSSLASASCIIASTTDTVSRTLLYYDVTNGLRYAVARSSVDQISIQQGSTTGWTVGTWYHVAVVRNGNTYTLYRNGVSIATGTSSYSQSELNQGLTVGYSNTPSSELSLTGYVSNVRVVNGTAVYTSAFTPSTTPLTAISGTRLLTCQSNRLLDNSTNAFVITKYGNVSVQRFSPFSPGSAYSTSVIGGSGYFDGAGDGLTVANNAAFSFGTGTFTIECWFNSSVTSTAAVIFSQHGSGINQGPWIVYRNGSNIQFYATSNGSTWNIANALAIGTITTNAWYHVAVTRSGSNFYTFLNGVAGATTTSGLTFFAGTGPVAVGGNIDAAGDYFTGYISDARLIKGTALYTSAFTPPTAPLTSVANTSLLLNFTNAGIIDNTMISNLETVGNAQISTAQTKFGGGSMYFDGTGDYLTIPSNVNLELGSGNFTLEAWIYLNAYTNSGAVISKGVNGAYLIFMGASNELAFYASTTGSSWTISNLAIASSPSLNNWHHVAVTREGSTVRTFFNGTGIATQSISGSLVSQPNVPVIIGYYANSMNGYIDDLRITKGIARYTTTFTPPTSAFPTY
jgi:hypothetical protein